MAAAQFRIELPYRKSSFYTPGQRVTGLVIYKTTYPIRIDTVGIKLSGVSEYQSQQGQYGTEYSQLVQETLFENVAILYDGNANVSLAPDEYMWPFEFTFPSLTGEVESNATWGGRRLPLPPSFRKLSGGIGSTVLAQIRYDLEAVILGPGQRLISRSDAKILFCPSRMVDSPDPGLFPQDKLVECISSRREMGKTGWWYNFKVSCKEAFSSSTKLPKSTFSIRMELPSLVVAGQNLPLFMGVDHDLEKSNARDIPLVFLKEIKVRLDSTTRVGAVGTLGMPMGRQKPVTEVFAGPSMTIESTGLVLSERMDLREHLRQHLLLRNYLPSFEMPTVTRSYSMLVSIQIACAGKTFKLDFEVPELIVLSCVSGVKLIPEIGGEMILGNEMEGDTWRRELAAGGRDPELEGNAHHPMHGGELDDSTRLQELEDPSSVPVFELE
jgi:Arrestin (or S-antigen), N-terminal domain